MPARSVLSLAQAACALAVVAAVAATPARAEPPATIEIGALGGWAFKHQINELGNGVVKEEVPVAGPGFGLRGGYAFSDRVTAEGEFRYTLSKLRQSGDASNITTWRAGATFALIPDGDLRPFARAGLGLDGISTASPNADEPEDMDAHLFVGAGTRFDLNEFLGLRLDAVVSLVPIRGCSYGLEPELWLSATYRIGGKAKDSDEDGISDREDKCRLDAEDRDGWQDEDGCPELDNDGDGLLDTADRCPDVAETKNGVRDDDGCPDADKDGDGIDDEHDKCPPVPENKNGFEDDDGCPDDPDSDGDGIPDSRDNCPKDKETRNNLDDEDGCPDQSPDGDGDGIEDTLDKCPRDPETKNGFSDSDGCPDKVPDKLKKYMGVLGVGFEGTSAQLTAKAQTWLDGLAAALQAHTEVKATLVGFADDEKAGQGQAGAVRYYLMSKGIEADRLVASGVALGADKAKGKGPRIEIVYQ